MFTRKVPPVLTEKEISEVREPVKKSLMRRFLEFLKSLIAKGMLWKIKL